MHESELISQLNGRIFPVFATRASKNGSANSRRSAHPALLAVIFAAFAITTGFSTEATNSVAQPLNLPQLPDAGPSVLRVMGALALVLGIFLGGVWLYRNWQRLTIQRGRAPKLNVLETRPLGGKQALYVIGYEQERFLLASSPAGVNLLSHLPIAAAEDPAAAKPTGPAPSFAQALTQVLKGNPKGK